MGHQEVSSPPYLLKAGSILNSHQATYNILPLVLENPQRWRFPSLSGQPAPMLSYPFGDNFFHYIQSEPSPVSMHDNCFFLLLCMSVKSLVLSPHNAMISMAHKSNVSG